MPSLITFNFRVLVPVLADREPANQPLIWEFEKKKKNSRAPQDKGERLDNRERRHPGTHTTLYSIYINSYQMQK